MKPRSNCADQLAKAKRLLETRKKELEALRLELADVRDARLRADKQIVALAERQEQLDALRREVALVPDIMALAEAFPDVFQALTKFREG